MERCSWRAIAGRIGRWVVYFCVLIPLCSVSGESSAIGQPGRVHAAQPTVTALMLSDIHFDPFHDPAKARRLADAPVSAWEEILSAPLSAGQAAAFAALQRRCGARGADTPFELLRSSLDAARREASDAKFIVVSGDLIAHGFGCRYEAVIPGRSQTEYATFAAKTIEYVAGELRKTFPDVPVYLALGNNDSGCGDYRFDGGDDFLAAVARSVWSGLPRSADGKTALADFAAGR